MDGESRVTTHPPTGRARVANESSADPVPCARSGIHFGHDQCVKLAKTFASWDVQSMNAIDSNAGAAAATLARTPSLFGFLSRLSVGRKLLLIYLLDLITVIFISSVLINEKYIAIDFSRKELSGVAYITALRPTLIGLGRHAAPHAVSDDELERIATAERQFGAGMRSEAINGQLIASLRQLRHAMPAATTAQANRALLVGGELVTRVGNQSNLILDPDLDSYYTMSLILLRYPALLDVIDQISPRLRSAVAERRAAVDSDDRTRLLVLAGELEAVSKAIHSDYAEAIAGAHDEGLQQQLSPAELRLAAAIDRFHAVSRQVGAGEVVATALIDSAESGVLDALDAAWAIGSDELTRLIEVRIHDFFMRMWLHLGTALLLLTAILLAVFYVARQISRPLRSLSSVVDTVRRTGDHSLRASWHSGDEIGRLVLGFNDMLSQLDRHREVQQELVATTRAAEAQQQLLALMPVPLMVTSVPDHRVLHANEPAQHWLGDLGFDPWGKALDRDTRRRFFQELADRGVVNEFEVRWAANDPHAWALLSARRLDYQGQDAVVTSFAPITRMKALEQRLELWAKVFEASSEGIVLLDARGSVISVNRAFCRAGGLDPAEMTAEQLTMVLVDGVPAQQVEAFWSTADRRGWWRGEVTIQRRGGSTYPAWAVLTAVRDAAGQLTHHIFSCLDISERKANEERVRYLAHHDVLTGLPNRTVAEERLRLAMQRSKRSGQPVAVMFIDLDRFKTINDSLGHQTGDELLKLVAGRLLATMREVDTVSRFGGDEFVVLLNGVAGADESLQIAQRLQVALRLPYTVGDIELNISCSIGIAMFPNDAEDMDELMRHADSAMYEAKSSGRDSIYFFTDDLDERAQRRLQIELLLRNAIGRNELQLVYQPQLRSSDGAMTAVEALLRWHAPELGEVMPAQFIPIAEESRLIVPIGEWVIDEACRQMAAWRDRGVGVDVVSVNVSAVQLLDSGLIAALQGSLRRHALPASALEVELTESTLMENTDERLNRLHALKALGLSLSIDDFGTGFSSLSYLSRLPMDKLKIDRSLVVNMDVEAKDRAITEAIVALAHRLHMTVVAEGVESQAVQDALTEARCDAVQGFHTGRPMPAAELERWIAARSRDAEGGRGASAAAARDRAARRLSVR